MNKRVSSAPVHGDLAAAVRAAVGGLGGWSRFIKPGDRVWLKPNFNTADPFPASSDPAFLEVVAEACHEAGASEVTIADCSAYYVKTEEVMDELRIARLTENRPWLTVRVLGDEGWEKRPVTAGQFLERVSVPKGLRDFDKVIFLPCLKTHKYTRFTGALKLSVGLMRPTERLRMHMSRLSEKVAELATVVQPHLIIMDGRKCFIAKGPTEGEVREPNLILAATDRVALDIEGVRIIQGFPGNDLADQVPESIRHIQYARELGVDAEPLV